MSTNGNDVYRQRMDRARAEMERQGVEFLFVTPSSDLTYLLGYPAHASERMTLLGIPRDGEAFIVAPTLEASRLDSRRDIVDVHAWEETESPSELVAKLVEGAANAKIGISDETRAVFLLRLQDALPESTFSAGTAVMRELRMCKDADEVAALRKAGAATDRAWEKFISSAKVAGRTEREVGQELRNFLTAEGLAPGGLPIVAAGANSASPHHMTGDYVIQEGDAIVFDFGSTWDRYYSDMTRTVHVGEPSEEFRKVYDIVGQANQAAFDAVKQGVECQAIDKAARDVIEAAGYGEYFIHRLGHGLGLDIHEEPYMVSGNTLKLKPGMVFSDEPGIYIAGRFGVRTEDILVCTEDGAESFNHATKELIVLQ